VLVASTITLSSSTHPFLTSKQNRTGQMCDESLDSKLLKQVILNLKTSYRNGGGEKAREDGVAGKRVTGTWRMLGCP
jgi:hypothetical protein